jgi:hypothetical protein
MDLVPFLWSLMMRVAPACRSAGRRLGGERPKDESSPAGRDRGRLAAASLPLLPSPPGDPGAQRADGREDRQREHVPGSRELATPSPDLATRVHDYSAFLDIQ